MQWQKARHPNLTIELRIANWTRAVADLLEGAVELASRRVRRQRLGTLL
ncbi:MAG TPA: hypothetical protein VHS97_19540 [Isosphaeraceae bacterium]|jgi:hypothetical protein|nr:hypothetical protein [Isosphaeraceae bacterium]